ncbi:MAG: type II toxin-antitoxin system RelE/ParE family toxin [Myxococcales bacterium]|nr:type II toxin-antitoxin system RelE/ParE family toxin [Myxococcales bacterium]MCB9708477.1 type II toxin-antitoxin system RelE/ParE family toxin [Myxococcales bacterium]
MIVGFADKATEDIFHGADTKRARTIPQSLWAIARRKLAMIDYADSLGDLRSPPSNRLEKLRGNLAGYWSIRINDQYRIVFQYCKNQATNLQIMDYHR